MAQRVLGIDVGTHSIKVVRLQASMRGFSVDLYDEESLPKLLDDEGKALGFLACAEAALRTLKDRGSLSADVIVSGLPGDMSSTRLVRLPFSDAKRIEQTLPFEIEDQVPFSIDEIILTNTVLTGSVDVNTDVLVGMAKKNDVSDFLQILKNVGADPRYLELDALALDDLYLHVLAKAEQEDAAPLMTPGGTAIAMGPEAYEPATAIIDIGHHRTSMCIIAEEQVVAARSALRGGADLTRALARTFSLSIEDAENGKLREAYLEVPGSEAPYPEQKRISDSLKQALKPIIREIRQSIQSVVAGRRARVNRIYLCGGSARISNLDRYLSNELNIKVELAKAVGETLAPALPVDQWTEGQDMGHAAKALAYALSGFSAGKSDRLDFRQGEFAYRGDFEFLQGHVSQLVAGLMVIAMLLGLNGYARYYDISRQEQTLVKHQNEVCKKILGKDVRSGERCLAMMNEQISTGSEGRGIPEISAIDPYLSVVSATPKDVSVKVREMEVTLDHVKIKGETDSFEDVDKIVAELQKGQCLTNVQRGPARKSGEKIGYSVSVDVDCNAKKESTDNAKSNSDKHKRKHNKKEG